jgi:hypothetical protein
MLLKIYDAALFLDIPHRNDTFVITRRYVMLNKLVVRQARQLGPSVDFIRGLL